MCGADVVVVDGLTSRDGGCPFSQLPTGAAVVVVVAWEVAWEVARLVVRVVARVLVLVLGLRDGGKQITSGVVD